MWAAIRSDFKEFVTTVKDESSNVLASSKTTHESDDQQGEDDVEEETQDRGVIVGEDGNVIFDNNDDVVAEEIERLMGTEDTFTEPLDEEEEDVKLFLESFDIESKTDDISRLLEENPETLQVLFEGLVPTDIKYEEFWKRYYYRCDPERIARQWELEREEARKARAEAFAEGINSVRNLLGGAVKAVSSTFETHDSSEATGASPFQYLNASSQPSSSGGMGLFGSSGRPPFVMNTAVDESDDEEEEEEELGWDDDDEEDDEEEGDVDGDDGVTEEIEFSGGNAEELDDLKQQLIQAMEERDQLHKTVEMQTKEIATLRLQKDEGGVDDKIDKFKMALFEKDAELAALRASLEDTHDDDESAVSKKEAAKIASQEREIARLLGVIATKDLALAELQEQVDNAATGTEQMLSGWNAEKAAVLELQETKVKLEEQVQSLTEALAASRAESEAHREALASYENNLDSQLALVRQEAMLASSKFQDLGKEMEELRGNHDLVTQRAEQLEKELQNARDVLQQKHDVLEPKLVAEDVKVDDSDHELSSASPSSTSTGIQIPAVTAPTMVTRTTGNHSEEDDWGDDWGDEDE